MSRRVLTVATVLGEYLGLKEKLLPASCAGLGSAPLPKRANSSSISLFTGQTSKPNLICFRVTLIESLLHFLGVFLKAERDSAHLLSLLVDLAPAHPVLGASFHM